MSCAVNHQELLRVNRFTTQCPDCKVPLRGEKVIDLTDLTSSPPLPPSSSSSSSATESQPQPPATRGLVAPGSQSMFQRFTEAHKLAKAKAAESIANTSTSVQDTVNQVSVHIFIAEEYIDLIGTVPTTRIEKLKRTLTLTGRAASLTTTYENQRELILFVKRQWNIPPPFDTNPNCRLIGPAVVGNGAMVSELSFNPNEPIRLGDIKPMMTDGGNTKDKFHLNLYFPQVGDPDNDDGPVATTTKKRARQPSSPTQGKKGRARSKVKVEVKSETKGRAKPVVKLEAGRVKQEEVDDASNSTEVLPARRGNRYNSLPPPLQTRGAAKKTSAQAGAPEESHAEASSDDDDDDDNELPSVEEMIRQNAAKGQ